MSIEWPPIPLYIVFAVVATWSSVLCAELRKDHVDAAEEQGLALLRKLLQWSGLGSATHLLIYLLLAGCKTTGHILSLLSILAHVAIVLAVMVFMTKMFTISFKRRQQTT